MNVTPTPLMFQAMSKLVDASIGEAPNDLDGSPGARDRRFRRTTMFGLLHQLVAVAMREGVNRAVREAQAQARGPEDGEDRNAQAKAMDHAHAGIQIVSDLGSPH